MDDKQKDYHYYSYGQVPSENGRTTAQGENARETVETQPGVEMAAPKAVRNYPTERNTDKPQYAWSYSGREAPRRPRTSLRSAFLSFLAGAVVVGGLMFASDRYNLFSGGGVSESASAATGASSQPLQSGSGSGSVKTAAMNVVRPDTIPELVEIASPAVVKIVTYAERSQRRSPSIFDYFFESPYRQIPEEAPGNMVQVGSGSGFFFDNEGYILTNEHVINDAEKVEVIVEGTKEPYTAKVLGTAYDLDLAVLKIEGSKPFPTLPIGNSDDIDVGDWVVAIGNPYEFDHTVTVGVLSAKERAIQINDRDGTRNYQALLQTDASINPGNSGGPLLNLNGEVIGINTAVNAQAQGIGFAIPTSTISDVLEPLKANKEIPRPYIGIMMSDVPEQYIDDLMLKDGNGAFVSEVIFGSPAYKAGLRQYDVVVAIDGQEINTAQDLSSLISKKEPGDKLSLTVIRNGQSVTVEVTVGDRNEANTNKVKN